MCAFASHNQYSNVQMSLFLLNGMQWRGWQLRIGGTTRDEKEEQTHKFSSISASEIVLSTLNSGQLTSQCIPRQQWRQRYQFQFSRLLIYSYASISIDIKIAVWNGVTGQLKHGHTFCAAAAADDVVTIQFLFLFFILIFIASTLMMQIDCNQTKTWILSRWNLL